VTLRLEAKELDGGDMVLAKSVRIHKTLKTTPAMAAGVTDRLCVG
jgi:hypothetical protein